jgi:hypothetical protein
VSPNLLPALDPTPLPGPTWLFHFLLVFTFVLHLVFMNLTLGGTWIAAIANTLSGGRTDDYRTVLSRRLMAINTYGISLTITTGIAPLLFVQVLYQQFFYTATILIGWVWFTLLLSLMFGYYAAYLYKFRGVPAGKPGGTVWLWVAAILFGTIAMVHVAVNLLHAQPDKWSAVADSPWSILGDPAYFPRLLHFFLAGLAFSGLVVAWWAVREAKAGRDVELNTKIARFGWRWALWTTVVQIVDGFLLLLVLPREVLSGVMSGGLATLSTLTLSILVGVGLLVMLARVSNPVEKPALVTGTLGAVVVAIAVMSIFRHQVRALYLDPFTSGQEVVTVSQWGNIGLFVLLLVVALGAVGYMVKLTLDNRVTGAEAA